MFFLWKRKKERKKKDEKEWYRDSKKHTIVEYMLKTKGKNKKKLFKINAIFVSPLLIVRISSRGHYP